MSDTKAAFLIFMAGVTTAAASFGLAWAMYPQRDKEKLLLNRRSKDRLHRYSSLSRTLDVAVEMSDACQGNDRAMIAVAVGEELVLDLIEPKLLKFLGFSDDDSPPKTVYDLLPPSMAPHHRIWVASAIRAQSLPSRLNHPLRNVEVRHASGFYLPMDLNIEWAQETNMLPTFHLVFAPCSQQHLQKEAENVIVAKDVRVGEQVEHTDAVVMLLDIVEFTKACSELSAVEVSSTKQGRTRASHF
jgi:hypothetical protein